MTGACVFLRDIGIVPVRLAGLQPAESERQSTTLLAAQTGGLCSETLLAMRAEPSGATANRCRFQFAAATRAFTPFATPWQQPRFGHEVCISLGLDRFFQNVARAAEELGYRFL